LAGPRQCKPIDANALGRPVSLNKIGPMKETLQKILCYRRLVDSGKEKEREGSRREPCDCSIVKVPINSKRKNSLIFDASKF